MEQSICLNQHQPITLEYLFQVKKNANKYKCSSCKGFLFDVFLPPYQAFKCIDRVHLICRSCINSKSKCKLCNSILSNEKEYRAKEIEHNFKNEKIMCPSEVYEKDGCDEYLKVSEILLHLKSNCKNRLSSCEHCKKQLKFYETKEHKYQCPNFCKFCKEFVIKEKMVAHLKDDCQESEELCTKCKSIYKRKDGKEHTEKEKCEFKKTPTQVYKGSWTFDIEPLKITGSFIKSPPIYIDQKKFLFEFTVKNNSLQMSIQKEYSNHINVLASIGDEIRVTKYFHSIGGGIFGEFEEADIIKIVGIAKKTLNFWYEIDFVV